MSIIIDDWDERCGGSIVEDQIQSTSDDDDDDILEWFPTSFLSSIHYHPLDRDVQYTNGGRNFYVKWYEDDYESDKNTYSVTKIVQSIMSLDNRNITTETPGNGTHDDRRDVGIRLHKWIECLLNGLKNVPFEDSILNDQVKKYLDERI